MVNKVRTHSRTTAVVALSSISSNNKELAVVEDSSSCSSTNKVVERTEDALPMGWIGADRSCRAKLYTPRSGSADVMLNAAMRSSDARCVVTCLEKHLNRSPTHYHFDAALIDVSLTDQHADALRRSSWTDRAVSCANNRSASQSLVPA